MVQEIYHTPYETDTYYIITDIKRGKSSSFSASKTQMTCRHWHESWMCTIYYHVHQAYQAMDGMNPNRSNLVGTCWNPVGQMCFHGFQMTILQTGFKHVPHPYCHNVFFICHACPIAFHICVRCVFSNVPKTIPYCPK